MASTPALDDPTASQLWAATGMPSRCASSQASFKRSIERNSLNFKITQPKCFFRRGAPPPPRAQGVVPRADAADRAARHPDARSSDFAQRGPLFLRPRPRSVLIQLDRRAGRDAEMEIELAVEIFEMTMAVDKAGKNRPALDVDHLGAGGNGDGAAPPDGLKSSVLNDDHSVVHQSAPGAVDQFSALYEQRIFRHIFTSHVFSRFDDTMSTCLTLGREFD